MQKNSQLTNHVKHKNQKRNLMLHREVDCKDSCGIFFQTITLE